MVGVDEAGEVVRAKMLSSPLQRCLGGFSCISLSMFRWSKDPAQFRDRSERRLNVALEVSKTDLTHKVSCRFLFHHPISKAKNRPMAEITEKAGPALFRRERLASHVCHHGGISPKRPGVGKIVQGVAAQPEPLSLYHRNI